MLAILCTHEIPKGRSPFIIAGRRRRRQIAAEATKVAKRFHIAAKAERSLSSMLRRAVQPFNQRR
jgi:hypothetical protein